jgi:preprotein translocase subunit SecY
MILALYRSGPWLPTPGVDPGAVGNFINSKGSTIFGLLNLLSGSSLSRLSLFALGVVPYVTASIVVQLLTTVSTGSRRGSRNNSHSTSTRT